MRISDTEVKKIINSPAQSLVEAIVEVGEEHGRQQDQQLVEELTVQVLGMQDRDEVIADLQSQIARGAYNPSSEEIVDAMLRRAIADGVR